MATTTKMTQEEVFTSWQAWFEARGPQGGRKCDVAALFLVEQLPDRFNVLWGRFTRNSWVKQSFRGPPGRWLHPEEWVKEAETREREIWGRELRDQKSRLASRADAAWKRWDLAAMKELRVHLAWLNSRTYPQRLTCSPEALFLWQIGDSLAAQDIREKLNK